MEKALIKIPEKIQELIQKHESDLREAWENRGEDPLGISFPVKIGFDKIGKPVCEVSISFTKEKVKDSLTFNWDEKQMDLGLKDSIEKLRPDGKDIESVTISSGGKSVTLKAKGASELQPT